MIGGAARRPHQRRLSALYDAPQPRGHMPTCVRSKGWNGSCVTSAPTSEAAEAALLFACCWRQWFRMPMLLPRAANINTLSPFCAQMMHSVHHGSRIEASGSTVPFHAQGEGEPHLVPSGGISPLCAEILKDTLLPTASRGHQRGAPGEVVRALHEERGTVNGYGERGIVSWSSEPSQYTPWFIPAYGYLRRPP